MLLGASEIIIKSVKLFENYWKEFLLYVLLFVVGSVAMIVLQFWLFPEGEIVLNDFSQIDAVYVSSLLFKAVGGVLMLWLYVAFIRSAVQYYQQDNSKGLLKNLEHSAKLIIPAVIAAVFSSIATAAGFLLLVIPGIVIWVWLEFALYEVATEEVGGIQSLRESKKLVEGRWWQVLWRLVFPVSILTLAIALLQGLFVFFLGLFFNNPLIVNLLPGLIGVILMPLPFLAVVILYSELKKTPTKKVEPHPDPEKSTSEHNVVTR